MADAPSNIFSGKVTGNFFSVYGDSPDTGNRPDILPLNGIVTLSCTVPFVRDATDKMFIAIMPLACRVKDGILYGPDDPQNQAQATTPDVNLMATDNPNLLPTGFQWVASYKFDGLSQQPPDFTFSLPAGATVDVALGYNSTAVPPGVVTIVSDQTRVDAQAASDSAKLYAQQAAASASAAQAAASGAGAGTGGGGGGTATVDTISGSGTAGRAILKAETYAIQLTALGLNNVNNTSDLSKPVSTAVSTALSFKVDTSSFTPVATKANSALQPANVGVAGGVAGLDSLLKVLLSNLPSSLVLAVWYNSSTNTWPPRPSWPGTVLWIGGPNYPATGTVAGGGGWVVGVDVVLLGQ